MKGEAAAGGPSSVGGEGFGWDLLASSAVWHADVELCRWVCACVFVYVYVYVYVCMCNWAGRERGDLMS